MYKDIEEMISKCEICLECQPTNHTEPTVSERPATRSYIVRTYNGRKHQRNCKHFKESVPSPIDIDEILAAK